MGIIAWIVLGAIAGIVAEKLARAAPNALYFRTRIQRRPRTCRQDSTFRPYTRTRSSVG